jgi:hypothetical protein
MPLSSQMSAIVCHLCELAAGYVAAAVRRGLIENAAAQSTYIRFKRKFYVVIGLD